MYRLVIFLYLWCAVGMHAEESFESANASFHAGDFSKAAAIYQKLIDQQGTSAPLLYNLGNSQFQLGEHGRAILAYERAKLLSPRDPALHANLSLARKAVNMTLQSKVSPWVDAVLLYLSRDEWSWLVAGAALWIGIAAVLKSATHVLGRSRWISVSGAAILMLLGGSTLYLRRDEGARGIVLAKDAAVRLSPFSQAEALGTLGMGRMVQVAQQSGEFNYVKVQGADLQGWMRHTEVERIER